MGILHLAGLGISPGAVTVGLSYLLNKYGTQTGEWGETVERVVLFTSPEVAQGTVEVRRCELNKYGTLQCDKKWPRQEKNTVKVIERFYAEEIDKGILYLCTVDVNDFGACFEVIAKTVLNFHPPGKTGAHIWANITGGSNVLNAALFQVAYLCGFIARLYYTFISDLGQYGKYLQPFTRNNPKLFDYREVRVLKTVFDERPYQVLEKLKELAKDGQAWTEARDLWSYLGGSNFVDFEVFKRDYLNVLDGRGLLREGNGTEGRSERVSFDPEEGNTVIEIIRSPLFLALARQSELSVKQHSGLIEDLNLKELWRKK
jgi:hypothetical protein